MDRIRFITHREQRILLVDFTDCAADEVAFTRSAVKATSSAAQSVKSTSRIRCSRCVMNRIRSISAPVQFSALGRFRPTDRRLPGEFAQFTSETRATQGKGTPNGVIAEAVHGSLER